MQVPAIRPRTQQSGIEPTTLGLPVNHYTITPLTDNTAGSASYRPPQSSWPQHRRPTSILNINIFNINTVIILHVSSACIGLRWRAAVQRTYDINGSSATSYPPR